MYTNIKGAIRWLMAFKSLQESDIIMLNETPCPRCGRMSMKADLGDNELSATGFAHICSECATEEKCSFYSTSIFSVYDWSFYRKGKTYKENKKRELGPNEYSDLHDEDFPY